MGSSYPKDGKILLGVLDVIPRAIAHYRIVDQTAKPTPDPRTNLPETGWQVINNHPSVALLEKCLNDGFPFIFGCQLFQDAGLKSNEIDKDDVITTPLTKRFEKDGRHAMLAVGCDSARRLFLIQTSWGKEWSKECKNEEMKGGF